MQPDFFTPICYENPKTLKEYIQEGIEDYFYLRGKAAYVIKKKEGGYQEVVVKEREQNKVAAIILGVIKICSYITLFIPLSMLGAKLVFRCTHRFRVTAIIDAQSYEPPENSPLIFSNPFSNHSSIPNSRDKKTREKKLLDIFSADSTSSSSSSSSSSSADADPSNLFPPSFDSEDGFIDGPPSFGDDAVESISESRTDGVTSESSVKGLLDLFIGAWNEQKFSFSLPEHFFNLESFTHQLRQHSEKFKKQEIDSREHFGYIEKIDLSPEENPRIYIRADLHGDLKSLIENLRSLQSEGLLDEDFRCNTGVHLVFLGDYCDRGIYGTEILTLLMRLREENPHQVHLIRGNHEYSLTNRNYSKNDRHLQSTLQNQDGGKFLESFYETMPLTSYFSLNTGGKREYVQCTHGLFELTMDPAPLLDSSFPSAFSVVPKVRHLSDRVKNIALQNSPLSVSAKRIAELVNQETESLLTAYNWADISLDNTEIGSLGQRAYKLSARDISHYLSLSSDQHKIAMIFRGHQHAFQHLIHNEKTIVTTLPVGMDSPYKDYYKNQEDRAYIIQPKEKVEDWTKKAILRSSGAPRTEKITGEFLLTSSEI